MNDIPFDFAYPDYPLAPMTLYKVGGAARVALVPRTRAEACEAYAWMLTRPERKVILGGGSNVLIADEGFPGLALITTQLNELVELGNDRYRVDSGVILDDLVRGVMLDRNYDGVGGLTGIPGTVGGAIYMNAGTVKGTICQLMESADLVTAGGHTSTRITPDLYGYRGQTFCPPGSLILGGVFQFQAAEADQRAIYDRYIQRRKEKQPQGNCCGSVFKNPEGEHAARLIEACGLKGTRHGGAQISPLHANFIMNDSNATAADIRALISLCKKTVQDRFGIELQEEVVYIS